MTKEEAVRAFCARMETTGDKIMTLFDAIDALLSDPTATAYVTHAASEKLFEVSPGGVECILNVVARLRAQLET